MSVHKRPKVDIHRYNIRPDPEIIATLHEFKALTIQRSSSSPKSIADLNLSSSLIEVTHRDSNILIHEIDELVRLAKENNCFSVPSRSKSNLHFIQELGRNVLGVKCSERSSKDASTKRLFQMTFQVLSYVRRALDRDVFIVKPDIFYSDCELFGDQDATDNIIADVSCMLQCTQSSLNIIASGVGVVIGELTFMADDYLIDCRNGGSSGRAIPQIISPLSDFKSDALFILLVQKTTVFAQLAHCQFYRRFPCIIISSRGLPDVATRQFLSKLKVELKLPVLALMDCNPRALKILSIYKYGSYDSFNMTVPDILWLGVRPSDLSKYNVPTEHILDMGTSDVSDLRNLLEDESIRHNPEWFNEFELMLRTQKMATTHVLGSLGVEFLTEVFLPIKLQELDLI